MNWYKSIKPLPVSLKKLREKLQAKGIKEVELEHPETKKMIQELKKEQNSGGMVL